MTIKNLRDQNNVRVLAYINPNLNIKGSLFQEGAPKGYFIKNITNQPYLTDFGEFYAATVDLTNPDAYNWYKGKNFHISVFENAGMSFTFSGPLGL